MSCCGQQLPVARDCEFDALRAPPLSGCRHSQHWCVVAGALPQEIGRHATLAVAVADHRRLHAWVQFGRVGAHMQEAAAAHVAPPLVQVATEKVCANLFHIQARD
eukprot:6187602-Pleurochrysis_carterae.AAC.4